MKKEKALDFDDLLLKTMNLLEKNLDIREKYSKVWKYIHIDEYQDTNKVQYKISKLLAERNRNICVVGDADQNIYSWRGANIENILNFEKDYKEAKVILLEKNYRSTKVILQAANSVIIKNSVRKDKKLFTDNDRGEKITLIASYSETDEARSVAQIIDKMIKNGQKPSDIAILFRTNFQSRAIEDSLIKMNIPYQMIGTKFFERKEIKDVLSYLRVSLNRDSWGDMARIINVPTRGIGKATLAKISSGFFDDLSSSMKDKINSFYGLLDKIEKKSKTDKPSEIIRFIIKESGLEMSLKTKDIEDEERLRNIYELVSVAQIYDDLETEDSLSQFMENASLSSDQDEIKDEKDAVRVMTVHASKGLEFDTVFITGLEQDLFPLKHMSEKEIGLAEEEEERRLFYVALTRAKKKVYLSYAITRKVFGSEKINNSSEFIDDIELELIEEHKAERLTGVKAIFSDF
jgi:DNA helicase-2/ATP-dependent DNA helicase PcrA